MRDQIEPARIEREAIYDDGTARHVLGLAGAALARARREGKLRYTRSGARILYLGEWLLDWLRSGGESPAGTRDEVERSTAPQQRRHSDDAQEGER